LKSPKININHIIEVFGILRLKGEIHSSRSKHIKARESSQVYIIAREDSQIYSEACEFSRVHNITWASSQVYNEAMGSSQVRNEAWELSQVHNETWESSQVHNVSREFSQVHNVSRASSQVYNIACQFSQVHNVSGASSQVHNVAWDSSQVHNVAWGSSQVHNEAWTSSQVHTITWGSSQVHNITWGSSQVHNEAWEFSQVHNETKDSSQVHNIVSNHSVVTCLQGCTSLTLKGFATAILPFDLKIKIKKEKHCHVQRFKSQGFFEREGIEVKDNSVILFKRVSADWKTQEGTENETSWEIGSVVTHPNWLPHKDECGEGKFHACSRPYFCDEFRDKIGDRYIAIKIKIKDLYEWNRPVYPHKIGFREGTVLYECDRYGTKI